MRVLLINELYSMGGSEIQTLREKNILREHGHEVWHLTFDSSLEYEVDPADANHLNIAHKVCTSIVDKIFDKLYKWAIADKDYEKKLIEVINKIDPDIIHLNVNNYKQITLYNTLRRYCSVQTIRDFSAVCPSRLCVDKEYNTCNGYCHNNCLRRCMPKTGVRNKARFALLNWNIKRVNLYHNRGIKKNLCPSQSLTDTCCINNLPTVCLNNSFDFSILNGFEKSICGEKKIYLVYGIVAEHKGIGQIIQAFDLFSKDKNVELQIVGKILDGYKAEFDRLVSGKEKIHYLGVMQYRDIIKHLEKVYSVIVPSLWLENYPNTALEGLASKCLVLGSNRGGIPELIGDARFTFDILSQEDVIEKLETSYSLSSEEYGSVIENNYQRVISNNGLEAYYKKIIREFESLIQ